MARRFALALLALSAALAGCARESRAVSRPSVRFECQEGCGSYKTVFPGETPPACCGLPMERAQEDAGQGAPPSPAGRD